jgi:hypothetical protein
VDRRVVAVGGFVGLLAMVAAWFVLGGGGGERKARSERIQKVQRPELSQPVRLTDEHRVGSAELRPDLAEKLRLGRKPPTAGSPPAPAALPEDGQPLPLDQDGIARAVEARRADLVACLETARFHTPDLPSSMTLIFAVAPGAGGGSVASIDVQTDLDASVFEGCALTVFQGVRFAATEPTTVRYPVSLAAEAAPR